MCGIVGIVSLERAIDPAWLRQAAACLRHRGPDGEGFFLSPPVGLAHTRLAIIDLEGGIQPMSCSEGKVHLAFNGEIYNFQHLRAQLLTQGFPFRTQSDTEVLLNAYKAWGLRCFEYLRGMFAFVIYDERNQELIVAKDYFGKKSLYYFASEDLFIAASELKVIMSHPAVSASIDTAALDAYLGMGYIVGPYTIFSSVRKLKPATYLRISWAKGKVQVEEQTYWHLRYEPKHRLSLQEAIEGLEEKLKEAIRLRLVADVPVGALLSGGLDSGVVVALASQLRNEPILTFSVGFGEKADELPLARATANRYQTQHKELYAEPDPEKALFHLLEKIGEPFEDPSLIPTYLIAELARNYVKVVLTGDGGDEALAGYSRYGALFFNDSLRRLPALMLRIMHYLAQNPLFLRLRNILTYEGEAYDIFARYRALPYAARREYYNKDLRGFLEEYMDKLWQESLSHTNNLLDVQLYAEVHSYLAYDLLPKLDIATMAASLEARSPFLDREVMDFCARLDIRYKAPPPTFFRRTWRGKYLLRKLAERWLPPEVVHAPKKGFTPPIHQWLTHRLRPLLEEVLLDRGNPMYFYLNYEPVGKTTRAYLGGEIASASMTWRLFILGLWFAKVYKELACKC
ncbi:MAG: asparagine synthase (glutamine-hydrolyzing) [Bacteroidia bacterium]